MRARRALLAGWIAVLAIAGGVRLWNALAGPRMWGYDAWGHVAYVLYLDLYRAVPWADQGWSYFHPPFHYLIGWLLAQAGSGEVLMRGLMLWGSLASLLTAGLAAWLARTAFPARPALAWLAFAAVACLPVHYYMSPMPGNEMTATLLGAAALASFVASERAERRSLAVDALTGALLGLGLLTKFSGLVTVVALLAALALRAGLETPRRPALRRAAVRGAVIAGVALGLCAPYYARNFAAFGTPFELSRGYPLVAEVERGQPPGVRRWRDFATLSTRVFSDPNPLAPHMYRSVWGSAYVNVWADLYRESDVARALEAEREARRSTTLLALLGLLPSGLAFAGAGLALRDVVRGRRRALWLAPLCVAGATLASFALFAWQVPIWSALKAGYLLGLSLPFALFLARAFEALLAHGQRRLCLALGCLLAAIALATSLVALDGAVLPRRADAPATGAVRFYFGEYPAARPIYERLIAGSAYPVPWLDNLAAVELADGHPERAHRLYARAVALELERGRFDVYRHGQLAVATALAGDLMGAQALLDEALDKASVPELLANRGALAIQLGDLAAAAIDLRAAIALAPELSVARLNQARLLERGSGSPDGAQALAEAAQAACRPPRGYPYGVGTGEVLEWGVGRRWLLRSEPGALVPVLPAYFRDACAKLSHEARSARRGRAGMSAAPSGRLEILLVAALVLAPLVVLLDAAVSIDAPVFVAVARQIVAAPGDPFGFQMIWDPTSPDTAVFNRNPPLLSYWLAPWIALFGERETVMHAALLPFPLIAAFAFRGLARRLAGEGLVPTLLLIATPAFGVLAATLMLDVPLLAFWLLAVYALVRGAESEAPGWLLAAGVAAAAAGLTKYIGFATAPLLAAGALLLLPPRRRMIGLASALAPPLLAWTAWGLYTKHCYGFVHFLGSTDVILGRSLEPSELLNQLASVPIYYGAALVFPVLRAAGSFARGERGGGRALLGLLLGTAAVAFVLPVGEPSRRVPLSVDGAVLGAFAFAGGFWLWTRCLTPARLAASAQDRFLMLWLAGLLVFSACLNWHVNAADALLAAPPALLLMFRDLDLRPSRRAAALWLAVAFPLGWGLALADSEQANVYRTAARRIAGEIGAQTGARWFVGHWGLQHYLEREGFQSVVPPMYGRSDLAVGDWVATARNVSQLDVSHNMERFALEQSWAWSFPTWLPLRATNADAGAGFYSHHAGYLPFAFSRQPLDRVQLGRVLRVRGDP